LIQLGSIFYGNTYVYIELGECKLQGNGL